MTSTLSRVADPLHLFSGNSTPAPAPVPQPTPPTLNDPQVQAAAQEQQQAAALAAGRASTIATSGSGVSQPPTVGKKTLLGGG